MKDIHTHILYGIDDGARTIEESLNILKKASQSGVTDVVLTPHFINESIYNVNREEKLKLFRKLKREMKKNDIDINIYLGNEVYIDEDIISLYKEISTINNSRYMLIELPLNTKYSLLDEVIYGLKKKGLIPIIAHPERYTAYYKDYDFFSDLIDKGCLLQANIGSLYGEYGRHAKKMVKGFLKRDMITFFGSDVHHDRSNIYERNIKRDLLKIVKSIDKVEDLLVDNTDKVLKDKDL